MLFRAQVPSGQEADSPAPANTRNPPAKLAGIARRIPLMITIEEVLSYRLLDNSVQSWLAFAVATSAALAIAYLFKRIAITRISRLAADTSIAWDDAVAEVLSRTHSLFLLVVALFVGSLALDVPDMVRRGLFTGLAVAVILQVALWLNAVILLLLRRYIEQRKKTDPASAATVNAAGFVARLVLWSVVLLLVLDNFGIDVTALVAGLGVGGIAVALATQNILGDLFASLSIVLDKPFLIGDFLVIGEFMGSVEYIGLKTTRLRSLSGEQLVFSNTDLLGSRIRNYGRMHERRVVFALGVTYQTPRDKLKRIPAIIREAVEAQDNTRFDRSHFQSYGDFSLNFETVYYISSPDYNLYMDIQQAVNLHIHERFEQEEIEFAYPTQTLFVSRPTGG
jgi:small-conductance mechanosensitive channel